jgi:hypothetical protein
MMGRLPSLKQAADAAVFGQCGTFDRKNIRALWHLLHKPIQPLRLPSSATQRHLAN